MSIGPTSLLWKPNFLSGREPMKAEGPISPTAFDSRKTALDAVDAWRKQHSGEDSVFIVTPGDAGGWVAMRYSEKRATQADASELKLAQAGGLHPQSFIVDSRGKVALLAATKTQGELVAHEVARSSFTATAPATVGRRVLPQVPVTLQVNHGRNVQWTPALAFRPGRDIEQLSDVMKWVSANMKPGTKVKPGGSRHSWSPAAATDSVYIHPEGMGFVELPAANPVEALRSDLKAEQKAHLVRVGAGTTIREINRELWGRGLAMPALGGFDGQTIAGVLPTGTHGSVLGRGPLAETIKSVDLVKPNGDKVRIEPSGGPTDAAQFARTHPGWTLLQDDKVFDASLINMGTLGVVHSYMLEVRDKFYLNEVRTLSTGRTAQATLGGGNIYNVQDNVTHPPEGTARTFAGHPVPAFHLELLWNPHSDKLLVTSRHPVSPEEEQKLEKSEPADFSRPTRDLFRTLTADGRYSRPQVGTAITDFLGDVVGAVNDVALKIAPKLASPMVDAALQGMVDKQYTQRSYNVFNIGDGANQLPAQSATLSVPLRGDGYLKAMDIMRDVADRFAKQHGQFQTGPISIRFVKGSRASLGDPEDVAKFELIFSGNGKEDQQLAKQLTTAYYQALHAQLGDDVRFHWGQIVPEGADDPARLKAAYPRLAEFEAVRRQFDPEGRMMNDWQAKMFGG